MKIDVQDITEGEVKIFRIYREDQSYENLDEPSAVATVVLKEDNAHIYALFGRTFNFELYDLFRDKLKELGVSRVTYERPGKRFRTVNI